MTPTSFRQTFAAEGPASSSRYIEEQVRRLLEGVPFEKHVRPPSHQSVHGAAAAKRARALDDTIRDLRRDVEQKLEELAREKAPHPLHSALIEKLHSDITQLQEKERLSALLSRVNPAAQSCLLNSDTLRSKFANNVECSAFVMSVDIRRSTELMLKARNPLLFAQFITGLCREFETIIKEQYGVFDKFTGDGVLAFFPDFFSGVDAGYHCMLTADRCHTAFQKHYHEARTTFSTVLDEIGLGIGIDFGSARLVQLAGALTIVGAPVVYACRMASAPAGITLLNQPAYEQINQLFHAFCSLRESRIDIKHEGVTLAYEVKVTNTEFAPAKPAWEHPSGTTPASNAAVAG